MSSLNIPSASIQRGNVELFDIVAKLAREIPAICVFGFYHRLGLRRFYRMQHALRYEKLQYIMEFIHPLTSLIFAAD